MQASKLFGMNLCLVKAGLTGLSGAVTTFATGVALIVSIMGKAVSKVAVAGGVTPTVDAITGKAITLVANQGTVVVWAVDKDGNIKVIQGSVEAMDGGLFVTSYPLFPLVPDTLTPFAYSIHKADKTVVGTFTFGVSNWNTAGTSHAATDVIALPPRPQAA